MPIYIDDPGAFRASNRPARAVQFTATLDEERPAIPGVDVAAVLAYLGMADAGGLLGSAEEQMVGTFLLAAIEYAVAMTGYEPVPVRYVFSYDKHPQDVRGRYGAGPVFAEASPWLELPRYPLESIESIHWEGSEVTEYGVDARSNPPRIRLPLTVNLMPSMGGLRVTAMVGAADVSPRFVVAVLSLAAYMYEHRGCDMSTAAQQSGASALLKGLRIARGGL